MLAKCIQNDLSNNAFLVNEDENIGIIVDLAGKRFAAKIMTKQVFKHKFYDFISYLKRKKMSDKMSSEQFSKQYQEAVKRALEACAADNAETAASSIAGIGQLETEDCMTINQGNEFLVFGQNKLELAKCIKEKFLNSGRQYKQNEFVKTVADLTARRFHGKILAKNDFAKKLIFFQLTLQNNISSIKQGLLH